MLKFTLITELRRPVALLLDDFPAPLQLRSLFALLPDNAISLPDLAQRWQVPVVLGTRDWAKAQRNREPMLKPKGNLIALLS
jgi:hypothetical protein